MPKKNLRVKKELAVDDLCSKCPACLRELLPPVFQCFNGHLLCESCLPRLVNCPVCQVEMPKRKRIRNFEIEKVIKLSSHPCPFKDNGCKADLKYDQLADHQSDCEYMPVKLCTTLGMTGCANESIPLSDFPQHVVKDHKLQMLCACTKATGGCDCDRIGFFALENPPTANTNNSSQYFFSTKHEDRIFQWAFVMTQRKKDLEWRLFVLRGSDFVSRCQFKMSIVAEGSTSGAQWRGPCLGLEPSKEDLEDCFVTPFRTIKKFIVKNEDKDSLKVTWKLIIEDKEPEDNGTVQEPSQPESDTSAASTSSVRSNKRSKC